jgi:hypothetical protein
MHKGREWQNLGAIRVILNIINHDILKYIISSKFVITTNCGFYVKFCSVGENLQTQGYPTHSNSLDRTHNITPKRTTWDYSLFWLTYFDKVIQLA